jgi:TP901 family phage tail tape measure protein
MAVLKSTLKLTLLDNVTAHARRISTVLGGLRRQQTAVMSPLRGVTGQLMAFGAGYIGVTKGIRGTAGAAMDFESAFADVRKVLNGSDEQLANVRRSILDMSKDLPIAASGIAEIYAAAGQANIPMAELNKFGEMVAKVSTAWEVPVAETGQALAEIKNQLNLGVAEVGLFADAINHLSNNTAANAPRLLDYTKRVAANGEMFGFTATQTLAFGGAMIATGSEAEVAATSFRNMGRALTKGTQATKMQRTAMSKLGLDSVKTAKSMQKDAIGTTLDVIEKIQKLPEWEQISIASALFGDEARSLMPIISNSTELRRQLGLVGDKANYAGSSFEEYRKRAETTANQLAKVKNNLMAVGIAIGDNMLPPINRALTGILDIFETLGERVTVFDKIGTAIRGFVQGLDGGGAFSKMITDIKELLFGEVDGSAAADKLGLIFKKFKEWGANVRELSAAIADNPIAKLFAGIAPYGFKLMLWGVGISMLAGTITKLAKALMFLSGASTIIGAIKAVKGIADIVAPGKPGAPGKPTAKPPAGSPGLLAGVATWIKGLGLGAMIGAVPHLLDATPGDTFEEQVGNQKKAREGLQKLFGLDGVKPKAKPDQFESGSYLDELRATIPSLRQPAEQSGPTGNATTGTVQPITIDSIRQAMAPQGTQDVRITNPIQPNITVNAPITINEASNGQATAGAVSSQLGSTVKSAAESSYMDAQ